MSSRYLPPAGGRVQTSTAAPLVVIGVTVLGALAACTEPSPTTAGLASALRLELPQANGGFEVWIVDQSDTRAGYGGTLHIFEGSDLMGSAAASARPIQRVDLAELKDGVCAATAKNPVRPHMLLFNREHTHAVLTFVASGHVVIFDAEKREPAACFLMSQSPTGQQAHAAFPAPDGSYIIVANQSGKRLERIDTNFQTNTFAYNPAATLDLAAGCVTPNGALCEDVTSRPINWPICPIIDESSAYTFVTLRGGGLFVVDARQTPMAIVAEYDNQAVKGNGCGGKQVGNLMYINSGGSPTNVSGTDPHHPLLYGFDVYRFPTTGYAASNPPNTPAPELIFSKSGASDSHGMAGVHQDRYVWVLDRHADVAEIIETATGQRVNTVDLNGALTSNAAPDLVDVAPTGNRMFVALRGPVPLTGDPHNAIGSTPGLGIIAVTQNGRSGELKSIVPLVNSNRQGTQQPDPHGLRVRLRK
jgi:hypothetical protein